MGMLEIFEKIASTTEHKVSINELIIDQNEIIKKAFLEKNSLSLNKALITSGDLLADKSMVVSINY